MKKFKILPLLLILTMILSLFTGCGEKKAAGGYEEGTSEADNIVNTTAADKVILVVSFGTSFNESRSLTIGGIEAAVKAAYPDYQVRRAFSSQIIIDKLIERDNLKIDNVEEAMNRLVLDNVKEVIVQPTTVMNGFEYDDVIEEVMKYTDKFESLKIGKPLLIDDSDYDSVADLIVNATSQFRADGTAIVFMGHGTEHASNTTYTKLLGVLRDKGYNDYMIGTVESEPTLEEVQTALTEMGVTKVVLRPLMIVAGDHANNDMAGDEEDSWKVILTEAGYTVETVIEGLGQIKGIQDLFVKHIQDAMNSESITVASAATAAGVTADRIENGTYSIEVDSSTAMFRIVDCQLTVEDDIMAAVMTLSGQGFSKVYMGTGEQALTDESNLIDFVDNGEQHVFTIPVEALDRNLECSGMSARKLEWYDHIVVFKSLSISDEAFLPCQINAGLVGGTGKAKINSPANLTYKDGTNIAEVVWSSPNYTYMIVNGTEYLPVNTEGNSTFEIPVLLDTDMRVKACTVAMSEPKEIDYILYFDSLSIK